MTPAAPMLSMDDMLAIVKPHNDKIIAEGRAADLEREIDRLHAKIFDLKSSLGGLSALMQDDIANGRIVGTKLRLDLLAQARELSHPGCLT